MDHDNKKKEITNKMGRLAFTMFQESSTSLAVLNKQETVIVMINKTMKERMGELDKYPINKIFQTDKETYVTINDVPCKLNVISLISPELSVVEMFPAHTKKWDEKSDLVYLTDMTSDGVWEWYPELDFEYKKPLQDG